MKLSEAIRLGAMLQPRQAFGYLRNPDTGATCALGAAMEAAVGRMHPSRNEYSAKAPEEWRPVALLQCACPTCGRTFKRVDEAIIHLNSVARWSRERIADWVEGIENELNARAVPEDTPAKTLANA